MRSQYPCDINSYRHRAKISLGTFSFLDMQSYTAPEAPADSSSLLGEQQGVAFISWRSMAYELS